MPMFTEKFNIRRYNVEIKDAVFCRRCVQYTTTGCSVVSEGWDEHWIRFTPRPGLGKIFYFSWPNFL